MSSTPRNPQAKKADRNPDTQASRREALRLQQEAEAKKARQRRIAWVVAGLLALALLIGGGIWAGQQLGKKGGDDVATSQQMTTDKSGWAIFPEKAKADAPEVKLYTDFQCPGCKMFEQNFGEKLVELAKSGDIKLSYHTMTFLDANVKNDSSMRAARAAGCATKTGKYVDYFKTIYANQPPEGDGFTDDQLLKDYPQQAGIDGSGQETMQRCFRSGEMNTVVENADKANQKYLYDKLGESFGTPTIMVGDKMLDMQSIYDATGKVAKPEQLLEAIKNTK